MTQANVPHWATRLPGELMESAMASYVWALGKVRRHGADPTQAAVLVHVAIRASVVKPWLDLEPRLGIGECQASVEALADGVCLAPAAVEESLRYWLDRQVLSRREVLGEPPVYKLEMHLAAFARLEELSQTQPNEERSE